MKSYNHLFEKLISYENIELALNNAAKRKHTRGDVQFIFSNKKLHIEQVISILKNNKFKPQIHNLVEIHDGINKKKRYIIQPYFYRNQYGNVVYEQIIHHAVVQILRPIFEKSMYFHSNGSIPGRGCHTGKKYLDKCIRENKNSPKIKYFFKGDIHHYYQSVNINLLKEKLKVKIHDEKFLQVVFAILDSNIAFYKKEKVNVGLPIGFYSSQWFANFYLEEFDHYVKETLRVPYYFRYMDDFLIFHPNKKELWEKVEQIKNFFDTHSISLKPNYKLAQFHYINQKTGKELGEPVDFMGFKFYRNRTVLRKYILQHTKITAHNVHAAYLTNTLTWYLASRMISYYGWFKVTNTYKYFQDFIRPFAHIKLCKKIISKHNKKQHKKFKYLRKLEEINKNLRRNEHGRINMENIGKYFKAFRNRQHLVS